MIVNNRTRNQSATPIRRGFASTLAAFGVATLTAGLVLGMPSSASAKTDPKGNNGTVKVGDTDLAGNANNPMVDCQLSISWFGFGLPDGQSDTTATVSFALQAPTKGGDYGMSVVGDATPTFAPSGTFELNHTEYYELAFTGEPTTTGYHVKITVNTPYANSVQSKFKSFWVAPCGDTTPTDVVTETPTDGVTDTPTDGVTDAPTDGVTDTPADVVADPPADVVADPPALKPSKTVRDTPIVLPAELSRHAAKAPQALPTAVDAGLSAEPAVGSTGTSSNGLVVAGLFMIFAAASLFLGGRRRGTRQA